MIDVCVSFCCRLWWSPGKEEVVSTNTSQLTCSPLFSFTIWDKHVNSSECPRFFCHKYLFLHILIKSFIWGCLLYFSMKAEPFTLGFEIRTSEWSNDRSLLNVLNGPCHTSMIFHVLSWHLVRRSSMSIHLCWSSTDTKFCPWPINCFFDACHSPFKVVNRAMGCWL